MQHFGIFRRHFSQSTYWKDFIMGGATNKIFIMFKNFIPIAGISLAILAGFIAMLSLKYTSVHRFKTSAIEITAGEPLGQLVLMSDLEIVKLSVENLRQMLDSLTIPNETKTAVQLNKLRFEINAMKSSLNKIEEVILDDPVKALKLPLMERELNNIKEVYRNEILNIRSEINRVYDMSKWLFYVMIMMVIALLSVAIPGFFQSRRG